MLNRPRLGATALVLHLALRALPALAAEPAPAHDAVPAELRGAFLELVLNGVVHDAVPTYLDGADVWVRVDDLAAAGLATSGGTEIRGIRYVRLASQGPIRAFAVDEDAVRLDITAEPSALRGTAVDLGQGGPPPGTVYTQDPSLFVNYGVRTLDARSIDGSAEIGATLGSARAYSGVTLPFPHAPVRGLSNVTVDLRAQRLQIVAGDAFASGGALGGGAYIGGLQVARTFALDPYDAPGPAFDHQATVMTPSTLEVYVDGRLTHRQDVGPGPLDVANIPTTAGAGDTRIVLRDAFGREQVVRSSYYRPLGLLAPGRHEYAYTAGVVRHGVGTESFDYREAGALGYHRVGLGRALTAAARLELAVDRVSGGGGVTLAPKLGQIDVAGAASASSAGPGGAASVAYARVSRRAGASLFGRLQSPSYATLSLAPEMDRALVDTGVSFSLPVTSRGSVSASVACAAMRDLGPSWRATVSGSVRLPARLQATLLGSVVAAQELPAAWSVDVGLVRGIGRRTIASAHVEAGDAGALVAAEASASPPTGPGVGYRVGVTAGTAEQVHGRVDARVKFGRADASYTWTPEHRTAMAGVAGGIVVIGGRAFATRPVDSSYALVRVPGVRGVQATLNNNPIGRTNRHGDVIVTGLLPYYGNRLGIAHDDVPSDQALDAREQPVAPPPRSGALVVFPSAPLRAVRGRLVVNGGDPAFGELTVATDAGPVSSPIGRDGAFELADLGVGEWSFAARYPGGQCAGDLTVPAGAQLFEIGSVPCGFGTQP